jgi:hypothetical protein
VFVPLLETLLHAGASHRIVDLCSGGGGPWPVLLEKMRARGHTLEVRLTDLAPDRSAFRALHERSQGAISFIETPVDATAVPPELVGVRTIFNGFHHFRPGVARKLLVDAAARGQPIGVFEMMARTPIHVLSAPLILLLVLLVTPLIRPLRWGRLFWTYLVPVLPLIIMWDGLVSALRVYSTAELEQLVAGIDAPGYQWTIGTVVSGPVKLPYLLGIPRQPAGRS